MTMTPAEIRVRMLELARPNVSLPDVELWTERARALEDYVTEGQSRRTPRNGRKSSPKASENSSEPGVDQLDIEQMSMSGVTTDD